MAPAARATATRSRWLDLLCLTLMLTFLVLAAPRMRVYWRIVAARAAVVQVDPDGSRHVLPTPSDLQGPISGKGLMKHRIRAFREGPAGAELAERVRRASPGARLEWLVEWSVNTLRFDRSEVVE